jgi:hypothetical protein
MISWERIAMEKTRAASVDEDKLHAATILSHWLPLLIQVGYTRKELEHKSAGDVYELAGRIIHDPALSGGDAVEMFKKLPLGAQAALRTKWNTWKNEL